MAPVARKFIEYPPGSPERAIQDAIAARYGDNNEAFFNALGERLLIRPDSASGTFYAYLAKRRSLPDSHREAYIELLGISEKTVREAERPAVNARVGQDPLVRLEAEVGVLRAVALRLIQASDALVGQVEALGGSVPAEAVEGLAQAGRQLRPGVRRR